MKNTILSVIFLAMVGITSAQEVTFETALKESVAALDTTRKVENLASIVDRIDRISQSETGRWEAFYYLAYARIRYSFAEQDREKKDALLDLAQKSIKQAEKLNGNQSELLVLQAFLYQGRIQVSASRGMTYSQKARDVLSQALELNPENPRALYLMGQNVFHTPKFFGGGAKNAVGSFLSARKIFEASENQEGLAPSWGAKANQRMLDLCVKEIGDV